MTGQQSSLGKTLGRLAGKNILVTGGSRGIGKEIAKLCAQNGASVGLTLTSDPERATGVINELRECAINPSQKFQAFTLNLSDEKSIQACFDQFVQTFGSIEGLVNNAGLTKDQLLLRMSADDFDTVIQSNLRGTFLCTKAASKLMLKARQGSIVHIVSVIGQMGNAGQVNYAASKAGIEGLSRSVAKELASRQIRSNCIAPGYIQTEMTDKLDENQKKAILDGVPLGKMGQGQDVGYGVVYLLSDESQYVTGQTLNINGGLFIA